MELRGLSIELPPSSDAHPGQAVFDSCSVAAGGKELSASVILTDSRIIAQSEKPFSLLHLAPSTRRLRAPPAIYDPFVFMVIYVRFSSILNLITGTSLLKVAW